MLDKFLAASRVQHSISPWASPVVVVPKQSGGVRTTADYKQVDKHSIRCQLLISRVDEVLDALDTGRIFSLFGLVSFSFQITLHADTIPLIIYVRPRTFSSGWLCLKEAARLEGGS